MSQDDRQANRLDAKKVARTVLYSAGAVVAIVGFGFMAVSDHSDTVKRRVRRGFDQIDEMSKHHNLWLKRYWLRAP